MSVCTASAIDDAERRRPTDLLAEDHRVGVVGPSPAVGRVVLEPQQAELTEATEQVVGREVAGRLPVVGVGVDLGVDQVPHGLAEQVVVLGESQHRRISVLGSERLNARSRYPWERWPPRCRRVGGNCRGDHDRDLRTGMDTRLVGDGPRADRRGPRAVAGDRRVGDDHHPGPGRGREPPEPPAGPRSPASRRVRGDRRRRPLRRRHRRARGAVRLRPGRRGVRAPARLDRKVLGLLDRSIGRPGRGAGVPRRRRPTRPRQPRPPAARTVAKGRAGVGATVAQHRAALRAPLRAASTWSP